MSVDNFFDFSTVRLKQTGRASFGQSTDGYPRIKTPRVQHFATFRSTHRSNPRKFEQISSSTSIESILSTSRKMKEVDMQYWIDAQEPSPLEILEKIAEDSSAHTNIMKKIIYELENLGDVEDDDLFKHTEAKYDEIVRLQLETSDMEKQIKDLNQQITELNGILQAEKARQELERKEYESYEALMKRSTFTPPPPKIVEPPKKVERTLTKAEAEEEEANINSLMGENRYLKDQMTTILARIEENREYMTSFTMNSAKRIYKASKRKKDEELNNQFI